VLVYTSSKQVLVLCWLRTEDEVTEMEMAGIHEFMIALLFNDLNLPTPPYARKPPIRVHETQGIYIQGISAFSYF
jgi:hypothetical protein